MVQKTEYSPLENYNVVGVVVGVLSLICVLAVYRVSVVVKGKRI